MPNMRQFPIAVLDLSDLATVCHLTMDCLLAFSDLLAFSSPPGEPPKPASSPRLEQESHREVWTVAKFAPALEKRWPASNAITFSNRVNVVFDMFSCDQTMTAKGTPNSGPLDVCSECREGVMLYTLTMKSWQAFSDRGHWSRFRLGRLGQRAMYCSVKYRNWQSLLKN